MLLRRRMYISWSHTNLSFHRGLLAHRTFVSIYIVYLLVLVLPINCVSLPGKHFIPLSLSNCLNSFLTIFHRDPCVLPIQISLPDQPVLLAIFPSGLSVSAPSTWNSLPAHIRSIDTLSTFKRHLKFHLFQSAFTV